MLSGELMKNAPEIKIATSEDAEAALDFIMSLQAEKLPTIFHVETPPTLEEEVRFLRNFETNPNSSWLAAMLDGAKAGCYCGRRERYRCDPDRSRRIVPRTFVVGDLRE